MKCHQTVGTLVSLMSFIADGFAVNVRKDAERPPTVVELPPGATVNDLFNAAELSPDVGTLHLANQKICDNTEALLSDIGVCSESEVNYVPYDTIPVMLTNLMALSHAQGSSRGKFLDSEGRILINGLEDEICNVPAQIRNRDHLSRVITKVQRCAYEYVVNPPNAAVKFKERLVNKLFRNLDLEIELLPEHFQIGFKGQLTENNNWPATWPTRYALFDRRVPMFDVAFNVHDVRTLWILPDHEEYEAGLTVNAWIRFGEPALQWTEPERPLVSASPMYWCHLQGRYTLLPEESDAGS